MSPKSPSASGQFPAENPQLQVLEFSCEAYPDLRRVRVCFRLSEFQTNPNASLRLISPDGEQLAAVNIVNIFSPDNEITLHIPAQRNLPGEYRVEMDLFDLVEEPSPGGELDRVVIKTIPIRSEAATFDLK